MKAPDIRPMSDLEKYVAQLERNAAIMEENKALTARLHETEAQIAHLRQELAHSKPRSPFTPAATGAAIPSPSRHTATSAAARSCRQEGPSSIPTTSILSSEAWDSFLQPGGSTVGKKRPFPSPELPESVSMKKRSGSSSNNLPKHPSNSVSPAPTIAPTASPVESEFKFASPPAKLLFDATRNTAGWRPWNDVLRAKYPTYANEVWHRKQVEVFLKSKDCARVYLPGRGRAGILGIPQCYYKEFVEFMEEENGGFVSGDASPLKLKKTKVLAAKLKEKSEDEESDQGSDSKEMDSCSDQGGLWKHVNPNPKSKVQELFFSVPPTKFLCDGSANTQGHRAWTEILRTVDWYSKSHHKAQKLLTEAFLRVHDLPFVYVQHICHKMLAIDDGHYFGFIDFVATFQSGSKMQDKVPGKQLDKHQNKSTSAEQNMEGLNGNFQPVANTKTDAMSIIHSILPTYSNLDPQLQLAIFTGVKEYLQDLLQNEENLLMECIITGEDGQEHCMIPVTILANFTEWLRDELVCIFADDTVHQG
ncbi:hypothetical protein BC830DRAFT_1172997 [Chytriomyces sp. MP71]|nr:hypothetical protein BC830DRAFT_1172997 [Chytriomyces sp. MP71]